MEKDKSKKKVATGKVAAGDQGMELLKWEEFCNRVNNHGENPHKVLREMGLDKEFLKDIPLAEGYSPTAEVQGMPLMETTGEIAVPLATPDGGITFRRARRQRPLTNPQNTIRPISDSDGSRADSRLPSRRPIRRSPGTLNLEAMEGDSDSEEADRNQIIRSVDSEPEAFVEMRNRLDESPTQGLFNRRIGGGYRKHKKTKTKRKSKKTRRKKRSKKRKTIKKIRKKKKNNTRKKKGGSDDDDVGILSSPSPSLSKRDEKELNKKRALVYNLYLLIDTHSPDTYISVISPFRGNLSSARGNLSISSEDGKLKKELIKQINKFSPETLDSAINEIETILRHNPSYPDLPEGYDMFPTRKKFMAIREMRTNKGEDKA